MFVELHIIQNFAPSCLNRDDTNAPKDCEFGGYRRARISSQCIKRAIRRYFAEHVQELGLQGQLATRTKLLHEQLVKRATAAGKPADEAAVLVKAAMEGAGLKMDAEKTSVLLFFGEKQVDAVAKALLGCWSALAAAAKTAAESPAAADAEGRPKKSAKKQKDEKKSQMPDEVSNAFEQLKQGPHAADIALFGRMVAELEDMGVDAACQVAHAISTNQMDMEMDFYTAVDDLQRKSETGAGMMGIVEFNSSCFYRYSLLDTTQLLKNLDGDKTLAKAAALAFVKASIYAIPTGKQNSMAAQNLPVYIRAVVKDGAPAVSLTNAFLSPARPKGEKDMALVSIEALEAHDKALVRMYGSPGVKLDAASSVYPGHGEETVDGLLGKLGGILC